MIFVSVLWYTIFLGFEPATFEYTVHRSTNWAIDRLSYYVIRNDYIYISAEAWRLLQIVRKVNYY